MIIFYLLLLLLTAYLTYQNVVLFIRSRKNKKYITLFRAVLDNDKPFEKVEKYLEEEKDSEFHHKALLLAIYLKLENKIKADDEIAAFELKELLCVNGHFSKTHFDFNADSFLLIIMILIKGKEYRKQMIEKVRVFASDLDDSAEYWLMETAYSVFNNGDVSFLDHFLDGDRKDIRCHKDMIGIYKSIATALKAYLKADLSEIDQENLKNFAHTVFGEKIVRDLGLEVAE